MEVHEIDEVDRRILFLLQQNARLTATEIGEEIGVSDTTVRNRMERLESDGVVQGYVPVIDYERAGFQRPFHFVCTVPIIDRQEVAERALEIEGVVSVSEQMTGQRNLHVEAVGERPDDVTHVAHRLTELGAEVIGETVVRKKYHNPLRTFCRTDSG